MGEKRMQGRAAAAEKTAAAETMAEEKTTVADKTAAVKEMTAAEKTEIPEAEQAAEEAQKPRGKWFGRGIYGSKDVPIRVLDGLIAVLIGAILVMIIYFAVNGGFEVSFDTQGGSQVETQKLRYSDLVQEPEEPFKPGYEFQGWYVEEAGEQMLWDFAEKKVGGDLTLYARWAPAQITVEFDLAGGLAEDGSGEIAPIQVTFGESYGELPAPVREGSEFAGWEYDGKIISADTVVQMTGEHILTALWKQGSVHLLKK